MVERARADGAKVVTRRRRRPAATWPGAATTSRRWSSTPPRTVRDRPAGDLRAGAGGAAVRQRRRGAAAGQRHPVRPGRLGLDPRRLPRRCGPPARSGPAASGSTTTSRSSARCRTAATRQSGFGKDMSTYSFEEYTQVKHVMYDITAVARKDWHRTIFADPDQLTPSPSHDAHTARPEEHHRMTASPTARQARRPLRCSRGRLPRRRRCPACSAAARRPLGLAGIGSAGRLRLPAAGTHRRRRRPPDQSDTEKLVNWSNWPEYIDVDDKTQAPPDPGRVHQEDRHQGQLHRGLQRQRRVLRQDPAAAVRGPGHRPRHLLPDRLDGRPADPARLGAEAGPGATSRTPRQPGRSASAVPFDPGREYSLPGRAASPASPTTRRSTGGEKIETIDAAARRPRAQGQGHPAHRDARHGRPGPARRWARTRRTSPTTTSTPRSRRAAEGRGRRPDRGLHRQRLHQAASSGDIAACIAWTGDVVQLQADNPDLGYVLPGPGLHAVVGQLPDPEHGPAQEERRDR